jgi:hypothetical protein
MGIDSSCGGIEALIHIENALLFLKMKPSYSPGWNNNEEKIPGDLQIQLITEADPATSKRRFYLSSS